MSRTGSPSAVDAALERVDQLDPAEAFKLIGNETRLDILRELADADERPVSFSELRNEVGMRDSAQFNYHLQRLVGHFVEHTDEGYDFKHAGEKVIRAIIAGSLTEDPRLEPFEVQGGCTACGGVLTASYADEYMTIACAECGQRHGSYSFPPGGLNDRTLDEMAEAFDNRVKHLHCLAADGVCPECGGRMATHIIEDEACCLGSTLHVDHACRQCGHELCSAPGLRLLDHSTVVSFYRERGIKLDERPYWTLPWCVSDEYNTIRSREPLRIEVHIPVGSDELLVTMDDDLNVITTEEQVSS